MGSDVFGFLKIIFLKNVYPLVNYMILEVLLKLKVCCLKKYT